MSNDSLKNQHRVLLIPAAGFGRRVGSPEAKEMLPRPGAHEPLIELSLQLAAQSQARPLVVTRAEKVSLVSYLQEKHPACPLQLIEPTRDWPESLLQSATHWGDLNIVLLPDVDFAPHGVIEHMYAELQKCDLVFATFVPVDGFANWGVIDMQNKQHCEKPADTAPNKSGVVVAWGLFGFRREFGRKLLDSMQQSTLDHCWRPLNGRVSCLPLEHFVDLTRGPGLR